jgi:hypothetical protein
MPITKKQDIIDELSELRSEIVATRQETRVLARLLGVEDQLNAALLEHQVQQDAEAREHQQRRQKFLDSDSDPKTD